MTPQGTPFGGYDPQAFGARNGEGTRPNSAQNWRTTMNLRAENAALRDELVANTFENARLLRDQQDLTMVLDIVLADMMAKTTLKTFELMATIDDLATDSKQTKLELQQTQRELQQTTFNLRHATLETERTKLELQRASFEMAQTTQRLQKRLDRLEIDVAAWELQL